MPWLKCVEKDCSYEWFEASHLAEGGECVECGGRTTSAGRDEEVDDSLERASAGVDGARIRPRVAFARNSARAVLRNHKVIDIPIPVIEIALREGLEVRESSSLPSGLRARLVGRTIEISMNEPKVAQRFSIAHEVGHHHMGTSHAQAQAYEIEADRFAGDLLVPKRFLAREMESTTSASELAQRFQVSQMVIEIAAQHYKVDSTLN